MAQQQFAGLDQPAMVFRETWVGLAIDLLPALEQGVHLLFGGGHFAQPLAWIISTRLGLALVLGSRVSAPPLGAEASERAARFFAAFFFLFWLSRAAVRKEEVSNVVVGVEALRAMVFVSS